MKTGSLRTRVSLITLSLLTVVLAAVVAAVTVAYRSKLDGDLRSRLAAAGTAVERAGSGAAAKPLVQGLALEGIATSIGSASQPLPAGKGGPARGPVKAGWFIRTRGSLLVLAEVLPEGTEVTFSASRSSVDRAVTSLLRVELLVAAGALAVATLLVLRGTRTALRPLSQVVETATRITGGDSTLRLRPSRPTPNSARWRQPSTAWSTRSEPRWRTPAQATLLHVASSPTYRMSSARRSPPCKRAPKRCSASNRNDPKETASRPH